MPPRQRAGASARKVARRKRVPRTKSALLRPMPSPIKQPPPPRAADPLAKRTGARLSYFTPEFLAEAKRYVEQTSLSTTAIAGDFGMHHSVLSRLIAREGWVRPESSGRRRGLSGVMRIAAQADELVQAHPTGLLTPTPALPLAGGGSPIEHRTEASADITQHPSSLRSDGQAIERLEAAVLKELATVERMRASLGAEPLRPMDAERTARTLSVLTETLAKLRRLRLAAAPHAGSIDHDDDIPPDIDDFRDALARRIELFVASRGDAGRAGGDPPAVVDAAEP